MAIALGASSQQLRFILAIAACVRIAPAMPPESSARPAIARRPPPAAPIAALRGPSLRLQAHRASCYSSRMASAGIGCLRSGLGFFAGHAFVPGKGRPNTGQRDIVLPTGVCLRQPGHNALDFVCVCVDDSATDRGVMGPSIGRIGQPRGCRRPLSKDSFCERRPWISSQVLYRMLSLSHGGASRRSLFHRWSPWHREIDCVGQAFASGRIA